MSKCNFSLLSNQVLIVSPSIARKIIGVESLVYYIRQEILFFSESTLAADGTLGASSGSVYLESTNYLTKSVQVLVYHERKSCRAFQSVAANSITQCKSLHAADKN